MIIGICDDELIIREELVRLCQRFKDTHLTNFDLICFSSGEEIINYENTIDILFLDIQMSGMNGLQTAHRLREKDDSMIIIFLTGHNSFMQAGYHVKAFRYLLKPVNKVELLDSLSAAIHEIKKNSKIIIGADGETILIKLKDIVYIEYSNRYSVVRTKNTYFETLITLNEWENTLDTGDFCRVHKSYIVNLEFVKEIGKEIVLDNEERVELSVRKVAQVKKACKDYRRRNAR